tara:strand:+ start:28883 stop:29998 length:1116 start_codon:yes stop_codon:yes gene_type:complete
LRITLFFTYGVSLKDWAETGLIDREILLYKELKKRYNIETQFLTFGDKSDRKYENLIEGISLLPIYETIKRPNSKFFRMLKTIYAIWKLRNEFRNTDILKTNQQWGSWLAVLAKVLISKPLIIRCGYNNLSWINNKIIKAFSFLTLNISYKFADSIHVSSEVDKKSIIYQFKTKTDKINVRPNWINTNEFKPFKEKRKNRLLFVGRLSQEKNISLLLNAIKNTKIGLDIIGDGVLKKQILNLINELNLDVALIGKVPNSDLPAYYNKNSIFILCSKHEGNPKALLEAMSCEMAVIGTDVIGIKQIINNNNNGLLVQPNSIDLKNAIIKLFNNIDLQRKLGRNARNTIIKSNSLDNYLIDEYSTYRDLHEKN